MRVLMRTMWETVTKVAKRKLLPGVQPGGDGQQARRDPRSPTDERWLSRGTAQAPLMRILIVSSHRIEGLTNRLAWLTVVLAVLTTVLAYDVIRQLMGN